MDETQEISYDNLIKLRNSLRLMINGASELCFYCKDAKQPENQDLFAEVKKLHTDLSGFMATILNSQQSAAGEIPKIINLLQQEPIATILNKAYDSATTEAVEFVQKVDAFILAEESKPDRPNLPRGWVQRKTKFLDSLKQIENSDSMNEAIDIYELYTNICGLYNPKLSSSDLETEHNRAVSTRFISTFNLRKQIKTLESIIEEMQNNLIRSSNACLDGSDDDSDDVNPHSQLSSDDSDDGIDPPFVPGHFENNTIDLPDCSTQSQIAALQKENTEIKQQLEALQRETHGISKTSITDAADFKEALDDLNDFKDQIEVIKDLQKQVIELSEFKLSALARIESLEAMVKTLVPACPEQSSEAPAT